MPPSQIISTPTMPTMTVLPAVVADTPVIDLAMFRNSVRALGEDDLFALLCGVGLDDANARRALRSAGPSLRR